MEYKYRFTVIIPIYNAEAFLEEAIQSVIEQDIGFPGAYSDDSGQ